MPTAAEGQPAAPADAPPALWPARWPTVALQECVDHLAATPSDKRDRARWDLPCGVCPEAARCLVAKRKELGPLLYDREIQTVPRASESSLFPRALFEPMLRPGEHLVPSWYPPRGVEERYAVCTGWDLAWSEKVGGDWLVAFTAVLDRDTGRRRLLDLQRWQTLEFGEQCALIEARWRLFGDTLVVIESDAAQTIWTQVLKRQSPVPVMAHSAAGSKRDLAVGVPGLLTQLDQQVWDIPWTPGTRNHSEIGVWLNECEAFGWVDGKLEGVGEHDDTVMAWWHCSWGLDRLAVPAGPQSLGIVEGRRL